MPNLIREPYARKALRASAAAVPAPDGALWALFRRLPAPLAELRAPADQAALATATRRGAVRLLLSGLALSQIDVLWAGGER